MPISKYKTGQSLPMPGRKPAFTVMYSYKIKKSN